MKELGEYLKETRISNGVSIDEAAQDLNIDNFLLESMEEGNTRAFKDILSMKERVKDYAKYLGLKPEEVIDEFNDYLFEKTSKISLQDIIETEKEVNSKKDGKSKIVASPYTIIKPKKRDNKMIIYGIVVFAMIIFLILVIFNIVRPRKDKITKELRTKSVGDCCEFAK